MARTKKQQPPKPSNSLANVTVAFAESKTTLIPNNHPDLINKTFDQLKQDIAACGGGFSTKVESGRCTHLITTAEQFSKKLVRVRNAIDATDIHIVTYDWLAASLDSNDHIDETDYDLQASKKNTSPTSNGISKQNGNTTKRARDLDPDDAAPAKKPKATTRIVSKSKVPVDSDYPDYIDSQVYEDEDGVIYDATLNQTQAGANANKFYRLQLLAHNDGQYFTWSKWGRVGERGQSKILGSGDLKSAMSEFNKKFRDKSGLPWQDRDKPGKAGKYTFIEINYGDSDGEDDLPGAGSRRGSKTSLTSSTASEEIQSKLPEPVSKLMSMIFNNEFFNNALASLEYDVNKMPLGKLSKKTLLRGYEVLKELASLIGDASATGEQISGLSNQYFSLIPHDFGRQRPPVLSAIQLIKKEIELLENLTDMQLANEIMKNAKADKDKRAEKIALVDRQYQGLGMQELTPLDSSGSEYKELAQYLLKTKGATHGQRYQIQDIFRIERQGEFDRFNKSEFASMGDRSDRRLLWHGSRSTNFGGILSQGLRIAPPEAPVSGYMFGKGIYLANMSSKSANYCASYNSGGIGLLLLCEAELGKPPLKLTNADYEAGEKAKAQKLVSTWGVGRTAPLGGWKDAGCVNDDLKGVLMPDVSVTMPGQTDEIGAMLQYDEFIVYDVAQVKLRYLLRVQMF